MHRRIPDARPAVPKGVSAVAVIASQVKILQASVKIL
jgi:hypothetical protein